MSWIIFDNFLANSMQALNPHPFPLVKFLDIEFIFQNG